jgi:hypothetical protein
VKLKVENLKFDNVGNEKLNQLPKGFDKEDIP